MQPERAFEPSNKLGRDCGGWITATFDDGATVTFRAQSIPAYEIDAFERRLFSAGGAKIRRAS